MNYRIVPDETVEAPVHQQKPDPSRERVSCPTCAKTFSGAAVVNLPSASNPKLMGRVAYCDHCRRAWSWNQHLNPDGTLANAVTRLRLKTTAFSEMFLRAHPKCAGVAQS